MDILRDIIIGIFIFLYATYLRSSRRGWPCLQARLRCTASPREVAGLGASAVPRSCKSWFPIALPVFSLTLPTASFAVPSTLSCVLESITLDSHFQSRAVLLL